MKGDFQVRFRERLGVRYPLPTRQKNETYVGINETELENHAKMGIAAL